MNFKAKLSMLFVILFIVLFSAISTKSVFADELFAGGIGTEGDPYQISDCTQLQNVSTDLSAAYVVINAIDCSDTSNWNPTGGEGSYNEGFEPIGTQLDPFTGIFDGGSYKITNLFIERDLDDVGLFGYTSGALIENIQLYTPTIYVGSTETGFLAGYIDDSTLDNTSVVGGTYLSFDVDVDADHVGGLVGLTLNSTISRSYATSDISLSDIGGPSVGGLVGTNFGTLIEESYATGTISSVNYQYAGGLAGYSSGTINDCYAQGSVSGNLVVGGLVGTVQNGTISRSYSSGDVEGNASVGGFIGIAHTLIAEDTFSVGDVTDLAELDNNIGGYIGDSEGDDFDASNNYWFNNLETPFGDHEGALNLAISKAYFKGSRLREPMNQWDFGNGHVWISASNYYPTLAAISSDNPPGGESSNVNVVETPSTVTLTAPEVSVMSGGTSVVSWTSSGSSISSVSIGYSLDDGFSFTPIAQFLPISPSTYTWSVPKLNVSFLKLRITGYNADKVYLNMSTTNYLKVLPFQELPKVAPVAPTFPAFADLVKDSEGRMLAPNSDKNGLSPLTNQTEPISQIVPGLFVRGFGYDTVYYIDANLVRHPFWNANTYFTHAQSFDEIVWVTNATLSTMVLGSPMIPKPGVILIKIASNPKVYAIGEGSTLQWIPDEVTAISLYGTNWADYVVDFEPTIMSRFNAGNNMKIGDTVDLLKMKTSQMLADLAK